MPKAKASVLALMTAALASAALFLIPYTPAVSVRTMRAMPGQWGRSVEMGAVIIQSAAPCVSLRDGVVRTIHAQAGETVQKGQLLFSLDTSAQEKALETLARMRYAVKDADESVAALAFSQEMEWMQTEMELLAQIEASQIRAGTDGVLQRVYVQEGQYAAAASLMGSISDGKRQIAAAAAADAVQEMQTGNTVSVRSGDAFLGMAVVRSISVPDEKGMVQVIAEPEETCRVDECAPSSLLTVEWLAESAASPALVPVSAVDADGNVWVIEDGRAYARKINADKRSGGWIAAGGEWQGCRIVLEPDGLTDGCRVKEAKQK